jgi:hypothetical protein
MARVKDEGIEHSSETFITILLTIWYRYTEDFNTSLYKLFVSQYRWTPIKTNFIRNDYLPPLGRPRCRWIDNIKMDLLEIGLNVVD